MSTWVTPCAAAVLVLASPVLFAEEKDAAPAEAEAAVSFYGDIQPILRQHCQGCHQPARARGDFIATGYDFLMGKGRDEDDDPIVVPGKPEESLLIEEITPQGDDPPAMPKDAEPLPKALVDRIARWIAEGAKDDTPASEKVTYTMESLPVYTSPPVITALDFSPDGTLLAVSGNNEVLLHAGDGSSIVARLVGLSERIESLRFSPDGTLLAVTGGSPARMGEVQIWDVEKRRLRVSYPVTFDTVYGASWSPDGTRVAFGCADNTLRAIDAKTGEQVLYQGAHDDWVLDTIFSKDSSHLVSVSRDRSMKLIMVKTEQFIDNITSITPGALKGGLMALDRHPAKDELLVGGADGAPKIYRMHREKDRKIGDDYNLIRKFDDMSGRIFAVEYSADGNLIVAGSSLNTSGEVRVYQEADGKLVSRYELPSSSVYAVTFRPDGQAVAVGGFDGIVRIVEATSGTLLHEFISVPIEAREKAF